MTSATLGLNSRTSGRLARHARSVVSIRVVGQTIAALEEFVASLALREEITRQALLRSRYSIREWFFQSAVTKEVRAAECDIVWTRFRTQQEFIRFLDEGGLSMVRTTVEFLVRNAGVDALEFSADRLAKMRDKLDEDLMATWRRFCERSVRDCQWVEGLPELPPSARSLSLERIDDNLQGLYTMLETLVREFEAAHGATVGRRP